MRTRRTPNVANATDTTTTISNASVIPHCRPPTVIGPPITLKTSRRFPTTATAVSDVEERFAGISAGAMRRRSKLTWVDRSGAETPFRFCRERSRALVCHRTGSGWRSRPRTATARNMDIRACDRQGDPRDTRRHQPDAAVDERWTAVDVREISRRHPLSVLAAGRWERSSRDLTSATTDCIRARGRRQSGAALRRHHRPTTAMTSVLRLEGSAGSQLAVQKPPGAYEETMRLPELVARWSLAGVHVGRDRRARGIRGGLSKSGSTPPGDAGRRVAPLWSRDGRELFYRCGGQLFAVPVSTTHGSPQASRCVCSRAVTSRESWQLDYDVAPDGRFLMIKPSDGRTGAAPSQRRAELGRRARSSCTACQVT